MTTRFEMELAQLERDMRNPAKKVTEALKQHVLEQRRREKLRDQLTKELGGEITCAWTEGEEPKKWDVATATIDFPNGYHNALTIEPYREVEGKMRLDPKLARLGYRRFVQEWALWKWHTQRGTEVDEQDNYVVDCELPKFRWEEAPKKVGRPRKAEVAASNA